VSTRVTVGPRCWNARRDAGERRIELRMRRCARDPKRPQLVAGFRQYRDRPEAGLVIVGHRLNSSGLGPPGTLPLSQKFLTNRYTNLGLIKVMRRSQPTTAHVGGQCAYAGRRSQDIGVLDHVIDGDGEVLLASDDDPAQVRRLFVAMPGSTEPSRPIRHSMLSG